LFFKSFFLNTVIDVFAFRAEFEEIFYIQSS